MAAHLVAGDERIRVADGIARQSSVQRQVRVAGMSWPRNRARKETRIF
jgi:hypothetical protein